MNKLIQWLNDNPHLAWKLRLGGLIIFLIGTSSLAGHILRQPLWYEWHAKLGMGLPTAVVTMITGSLFIALSWEAEK